MSDVPPDGDWEPRFVGREEELQEMVTAWHNGKQIFAVYGRRHVGKLAFSEELLTRLEIPRSNLYRLDFTGITELSELKNEICQGLRVNSDNLQERKWTEGVALNFRQRITSDQSHVVFIKHYEDADEVRDLKNRFVSLCTALVEARTGSKRIKILFTSTRKVCFAEKQMLFKTVNLWKGLSHDESRCVLIDFLRSSSVDLGKHEDQIIKLSLGMPYVLQVIANELKQGGNMLSPGEMVDLLQLSKLDPTSREHYASHERMRTLIGDPLNKLSDAYKDVMVKLNQLPGTFDKETGAEMAGVESTAVWMDKYGIDLSRQCFIDFDPKTRCFNNNEMQREFISEQSDSFKTTDNAQEYFAHVIRNSLNKLISTVGQPIASGAYAALVQRAAQYSKDGAFPDFVPAAAEANSHHHQLCGSADVIDIFEVMLSRCEQPQRLLDEGIRMALLAKVIIEQGEDLQQLHRREDELTPRDVVKPELAKLYQTLGWQYLLHGENDKAEKYLTKAHTLMVNEDSPQKLLFIRGLTLLGFTKAVNGNGKDALVLLLQSLQLTAGQLGRDHGAVRIQCHNIKQLCHMLNGCRGRFEPYHPSKAFVLCLYDLCCQFLRMDMPQLALQTAEGGVKHCTNKQTDLDIWYLLHEVLVEAYVKLGEYGKAESTLHKMVRELHRIGHEYPIGDPQLTHIARLVRSILLNARELNLEVHSPPCHDQCFLRFPHNGPTYSDHDAERLEARVLQDMAAEQAASPAGFGNDRITRNDSGPSVHSYNTSQGNVNQTPGVSTNAVGDPANPQNERISRPASRHGRTESDFSPAGSSNNNHSLRQGGSSSGRPSVNQNNSNSHYETRSLVDRRAREAWYPQSPGRLGDVSTSYQHFAGRRSAVPARRESQSTDPTLSPVESSWPSTTQNGLDVSSIFSNIGGHGLSHSDPHGTGLMGRTSNHHGDPCASGPWGQMSDHYGDNAVRMQQVPHFPQEVDPSSSLAPCLLSDHGEESPNSMTPYSTQCTSVNGRGLEQEIRRTQERRHGPPLLGSLGVNPEQKPEENFLWSHDHHRINVQGHLETHISPFGGTPGQQSPCGQTTSHHQQVLSQTWPKDVVSSQFTARGQEANPRQTLPASDQSSSQAREVVRCASPRRQQTTRERVQEVHRGKSNTTSPRQAQSQQSPGHIYRMQQSSTRDYTTYTNQQHSSHPAPPSAYPGATPNTRPAAGYPYEPHPPQTPYPTSAIPSPSNSHNPPSVLSPNQQYCHQQSPQYQGTHDSQRGQANFSPVHHHWGRTRPNQPNLSPRVNLDCYQTQNRHLYNQATRPYNHEERDHYDSDSQSYTSAISASQSQKFYIDPPGHEPDQSAPPLPLENLYRPEQQNNGFHLSDLQLGEMYQNYSSTLGLYYPPDGSVHLPSQASSSGAYPPTFNASQASTMNAYPATFNTSQASTMGARPATFNTANNSSHYWDHVQRWGSRGRAQSAPAPCLANQGGNPSMSSSGPQEMMANATPQELTPGTQAVAIHARRDTTLQESAPGAEAVAIHARRDTTLQESAPRAEAAAISQNVTSQGPAPGAQATGIHVAQAATSRDQAPGAEAAAMEENRALSSSAPAALPWSGVFGYIGSFWNPSGGAQTSPVHHL